MTAPEDETCRLLRRRPFEEVLEHIWNIIDSEKYSDLNTITTNKVQLNKIIQPFGWTTEEYYKEFGRRLWDRKKMNP